MPFDFPVLENPENTFEWMAFLASKYFGMFVEGTINTLYIAVVGTILGFVLGFAIGIIQDLGMSADDLPIVKALIKTLKLVTSAYVELFRNTPMIVQAMIVYYGLRQANVAIIPAHTWQKRYVAVLDR